MKNSIRTRSLVGLLVFAMLVSVMAISVAADAVTAVLTNEIANGDTVIIYYPDGNTAIGNTADGKKLAAAEAAVDGDSLTVTDAMGTFVVELDAVTNCFYFKHDGKYLTSGETGNSLSLADAASDYALWSLEEAADGFYIKNYAAKYVDGETSKDQYLEFYYSFTTYSFNESKANIYTFKFFKIGGETSDDSSEDTSEDPAEAVSFTATIGNAGLLFTADENGNVIVAEANDTDAQKWTFEKQDDNTYKIINVGTNLVLDVANGTDADGTNVGVHESNDSLAQRYIVVFLNDEKTSISLRPSFSETQYVDKDANSTNIQTWTFIADNPNQVFDLVIESGELPPEEEPAGPTEVNYAEGKGYTVEGNFYGSNVDDGKILTDGFISETETAGKAISLQGTGATNVFTINLGKKYTDINKIVVGGVIVAGNRQYGTAIIEVSTNGSDYKKLDVTAVEEVVGESTAVNFVYNLDEAVSAKYVKVTVISSTYILALSEIQVIGAGSEVDPGTSENPGDTGFAVVALLAVISLAGAVIVAKKRSI